jgi:hypothetical protein
MLAPNNPRAPRRFQYDPRFYDPTEDDRLKRRIRFSSNTRRGRRPPFLVLLIVFILVGLIYAAI